MTTKNAFYITTAISYPNGAPHIGHAYELIATDVLARFKRLDGYDVFFLTGTDEHGQKMQKTADQQGITPQELVNQNTPAFQKMAQAVNSSHDRFIRTTDADHIASAQAIWAAMQANGDIYKSKYAGWYSVRDEAFYAESETIVQGDGTRLGGQGTPVEWVSEESYFFRLSHYQDKLLAYYKKHPHFIQPESRRNEVIRFVEGGLEDLSISRTSFSWGVPVPDDPSHVMYVWVDALTNYITGAGYPDTNSESFQKYWPADAHIIGKDITRFHAVYWPAFLMSAGIALPRTVFGHGFLFNKGEKMSKSVGNVVDPIALAEGYGTDQLRYFLLREVPFGNDGSYSHEAIVARVNADLANDLGNLAQRSLSMIAKNCGATISPLGNLTKGQIALMEMLDALPDMVRKHMDAFEIHLALSEIFKVVGEANRTFAELEPWTLKKDNPKRMAEILSQTAEVVRRIAILMQPFTPDAASKLLDQLAIATEVRTISHATSAFALTDGHTINTPEGVFPRLKFEETT